MSIDWLIGTAEARINHFLRNNDLYAPGEISGSIFKVTLPALPLLKQQTIIYCHLQSRRVILSKQEALADVSIDISSNALIGLAKGEKLATLLLEKKMHMHGDIGKAHALQHWLESLSLTKEDAFAEVFGDTVGPLLSSLEQQAQPLLSGIFELGKNLFEQFAERTAPPNKNSEDNTVLKQQVIKLREQADRLEARVKILNDELQQHKGTQ